MATAYANSAEAAKGLGLAFNTGGNSLTPAQIAAINNTASLVPTVSAATLQSPQTPAQIPTPKTTDYNAALSSGNAIIGSNTSALSTPTTNTQTTDPFALLNSYLAGSTPPPSSSAQYATDYANAGIDAKTQAVNDAAAKVKAAQANLAATTAQIQGIAAEGTSSKLLQENTFGTTGNTIGQQAQIDRNYAVKAIPLQIQALAQQAEVASTQGDATLAQNILTQAQQHLDTVFQIHQQDATNQYNNLKDLRSSIFQYATQQQQNQLATQQKASDQAYQTQQNNLNYAQGLANTAITNGQTSLASKILALDPTSSTYRGDVASLATGIVPAASQNKLQFVSGTANQPAGTFNPTTGVFTPINTTANSGTNVVGLAQTKAKIDQLTGLTSESGLGNSVGTSFLSRAPQGILGTVGALASVVGIPSVLASAYSKLTGQSQNFISDVEQLRSQLNLDALIGAKAQGATFGALSDQELKVLASSATKLGTWATKDSSGNVVGYNTSEANFKKEIDKINNFAKLDYIIKGGDPADVGAKIMPDGSIWAQNSDGTFTQVK